MENLIDNLLEADIQKVDIKRVQTLKNELAPYLTRNDKITAVILALLQQKKVGHVDKDLILNVVQRAKEPEMKKRIDAASVVVLQQQYGLSQDEALNFVAKYRDVDFEVMVDAINKLTRKKLGAERRPALETLCDFELLDIILEKDIFKPYSQDEYWQILGFTKNKDRTWTSPQGIIFDPKKKSEYPILSKAYEENIFALPMKEIPERAKSFRIVLAELQKKGVKWLAFNSLKLIPPSNYYINSGNQAVGKYKDKMVIFESKVGVNTVSAGYMAWVGPAADVQKAEGSTYTSSQQALGVIIRKLSK
jgi:hypothetical protein